jgi:lipopolysaccharide/colanic/teichoic acid biosynthesis glycosyltransferase
MSKGVEYLHSPEKRAFDVVGSLGLLLPAAGVAGLSAVALRKEVGGLRNVLFRQIRPIGDDKDLVVPKLRTIHPGHTDDKPLVNLGALDERAGRAGKFIRQIGLDESLQIFNVLKGEMSLVGPRPRPKFELDEYEHVAPDIYDEWRDFIETAKPGIFGLSQVMRHSHLNPATDEIRAESMRMELEYRDQASLATDIALVVSTPFRLIGATQNAYSEMSTAG